MTQATGLYNVVRQVFGSVGIALAATELTRGTARYHDLLAEHVTAFDAATRAFLTRAQAAMAAAGADAGTAYHQAVALLNGTVYRQAAVLAYNHIYALVGLLFLISIPLVLLLGGSASGVVRPAGPPVAGRGTPARAPAPENPQSADAAEGANAPAPSLEPALAGAGLPS